MDLQTIKEIAGTIKDVMVSLGLLAGGFWAVLQFLTVRHDQRVKEQSVLCVELEVEQVSIPAREGFFLSIIVRVRNQGSRNTYLQYDSDDHLTVTGVNILDDGTRQLRVPIKRILMRRDKPIRTSSVLSGSYVDLPFFVAVPSSGLYVVRFYVNPNPEQRQHILRAGGVNPEDSIVISANKYVVVGAGGQRTSLSLDASGTG
jgi:hypothetical protein